jgi:hypothetical protein
MKLTRSTAHIQRSLPIMALVAAIIRLRARRAEQLNLELETKGTKCQSE